MLEGDRPQPLTAPVGVASRRLLESSLARLRRDEATGSGGEVNGCDGERLGEGLPAVDLAHGDLTGGEQRPDSIAAVSAEGSTVCVSIRRLNSSCNRSIAFVVRADSHCAGGGGVKANRRSPAS